MRNDDMPPLEDAHDEQSVVVGDLLVARRVLNMQVKEDLFHTRCFVKNKFAVSLSMEGVAQM